MQSRTSFGCRIPFYYILKLAAVIYLQSPKTRGAVHLKDVVLKVTTTTNRIEAQQRALTQRRSRSVDRGLTTSSPSFLPNSQPPHAHPTTTPKIQVGKVVAAKFE